MAKTFDERVHPDPALLEHAHQYLANERERSGTLLSASRKWKQIFKRDPTANADTRHAPLF